MCALLEFTLFTGVEGLHRTVVTHHAGVNGALGFGLVDGDALAESNINRQLLATVETIGQRKADAAVNRIKSINPDCEAVGIDVFYNAETAQSIDFSEFDYIVDAIDTVTSKLLIIENAKKHKKNLMKP